MFEFINIIEIWLFFAIICVVPAIVLGLIFHFCIQRYKLDSLTVLLITIIAIGLGNLLVCLFFLYVIYKFDAVLYIFATISSGVCGLFASLVRLYWLKIRKVEISSKIEIIKTILFFNIIAPILLIMMTIILFFYV